MIADAAVKIMAPFIALLVYFFAFWVGYRVIKAAVANGVREALGAKDASFKNVLKEAIAEALEEREAGGVGQGAVYAADSDDVDESAWAADSEQSGE